MSLDQNDSEAGAQSVYPRLRLIRAMARWGYRLACVGPFALWFMAVFYPYGPRPRTPSLAVQIVWWIFCGCSPLGFALGATALFQFYTRTLGARKMGANYAIAAMALGGTATLLLILEGPSFLDQIQHSGSSHMSSCISNLKQLGVGMSMYAQDYDERYPATPAWNDDLYPYTKNREILFCTAVPIEEKRPTYALNSRLLGVNSEEVQHTDQVVSLFDSIPGTNLVGGMELLPDPARHHDLNTIAFMDGHVKLIPQRQQATLLWKPQLQKRANLSPAGKASSK